MNTSSQSVNISSWCVNIKFQELKFITIKKVTIVFLSVRINNYVSKFTKSSGKLTHNYILFVFNLYF